jgi:hypothetical protein
MTTGAFARDFQLALAGAFLIAHVIAGLVDRNNERCFDLYGVNRLW